MSRAPHLLMDSRAGHKYGDVTMLDHMAYDGLYDVFTDQPMGGLTEQRNDVDRYTRLEQDTLAAESHQKAAAAWKDGVFADEVVATLGKSDELTTALSAYHAGRSDSLHLDDVSKTYGLAGECFSLAMEKAFAASHTALHLRSREILSIRLDHENKIKGEWAFVGRG